MRTRKRFIYSIVVLMNLFVFAVCVVYVCFICYVLISIHSEKNVPGRSNPLSSSSISNTLNSNTVLHFNVLIQCCKSMRVKITIRNKNVEPNLKQMKNRIIKWNDTYKTYLDWNLPGTSSVNVINSSWDNDLVCSLKLWTSSVNPCQNGTCDGKENNFCLKINCKENNTHTHTNKSG